MDTISTSGAFVQGGHRLAQHTLGTLRAGVAVVDGDGRIVQVDVRAATLLGLTSVDDVGHRLDHPRWAAVHLDMSPLDHRSDPVRIALAEGTTSLADVIGILGSDGETRWLAVTVLPLPAEATGTTGLMSLVEVTGIVRDRAAVDEAERLGRSAFDHGRTPVCVVDDSGWLVDWNRAFAGRLDLPDHEIVGSPVDRWIIGGRDVIARSMQHGVAGPLLARWIDGEQATIRCWRSGGVASRWMIEVAPME